MSNAISPQLLTSHKGQVALEGNFGFVQDKSDLKSASDKKIVRKATVALENKICEQNIPPCSVSVTQFPAKPPLLAVSIHKPQHERSENVLGWRRCTAQRNLGWSRHWAVFAELKGFLQRVRTRGRRRWAGSSSIVESVRDRHRIDPSWWILRKLLPHFLRKILVARAWIHVVAKWERYQFYHEVYSIETLLHITCQIISESRHPRYCFPRFVSVWPAPEVVDGIFEVCPSATKFCPSVDKPVALGFSLWWQIFDISKQFCPLVRLGP